MGIQKPVPKPDMCHPSFKPDLSGASNDPLPRMKSAVLSNRVVPVVPRPDPKDNPVDRVEELAVGPPGTVQISTLVIRRRKS